MGMDPEGAAEFERFMDARIRAAKIKMQMMEMMELHMRSRTGGKEWISGEGLTCIKVTRRIKAATTPDVVAALLVRHFLGDFGDVCDASVAVNLRSIRAGVGPVISAFSGLSWGGGRIYVVTKNDRSITYVCFAGDAEDEDADDVDDADDHDTDTDTVP